MLPYKEKGSLQIMIKLTMWTWGYDPGLSRWALNLITNVPIRERQRAHTYRGEDYVKRTQTGC